MGYYSMIVLSILFSIFITLFLMPHIKRKEPIVNVLFGLQITLIGMFVFYIVYNTTSYTLYANVLPYFIATYLITTGLVFSAFEYFKR